LLPKTETPAAFDDQANLPLATNPQLSQYRIIHLATHGIFNTQEPALSGIILSLVDQKGKPINGFLRLNDIFNLNLPAELVVLSACETGLGEEIKGEGLVGLTRGFMYAGTPRVLVSLWKVDDDATAEIMTRFYKLMLEKKLPPAQALRQAQLQMQNETEWKSPYYWSAFVLQGEWR
ncbi:MAG: CHAT domain-containing protein, partial [Snowella sp.]